MAYDLILSDGCHEVILNGNLISNDHKWDVVIEWVDMKFNLTTVCPICGSILLEADMITEGSYWIDQEVTVKDCKKCGYWQCFGLNVFGPNEYGCPDSEWECRISKITEYEDIPEGCYTELVQYLRANPSFWHEMEPTRLEKLVAEVFKLNFVHSEVIHVGRPDDGGVDVIFIDYGVRQWMIQVKRREKANAAEGVETIRNLLGTMVLKNSNYGMIVSTADHFTYRAYSARNLAEKFGFIIRLIDRGKLIRMVNPLLPNRPWLSFIRDRHPELLDYFFKAIPDHNQLTIF